MNKKSWDIKTAAQVIRTGNMNVLTTAGSNASTRHRFVVLKCQNIWKQINILFDPEAKFDVDNNLDTVYVCKWWAKEIKNMCKKTLIDVFCTPVIESAKVIQFSKEEFQKIQDIIWVDASKWEYSKNNRKNIREFKQPIEDMIASKLKEKGIDFWERNIKDLRQRE